MTLTRRAALIGGAFAGAAGAVRPARAAEPLDWSRAAHGLSAFGDLQYPPDFPNFAFVRPDAPKGGVFSQQAPSTIGNQSFNTFDSLQIFILKGVGAQGMQFTFDSLMTGGAESGLNDSADEPDGVYGLVARDVLAMPDGLTWRFRLRPEARFHEGSRITAADVAWSLVTLKEQGHPTISQGLREFAGAEAEGEDTVVVRLTPQRSRTLIGALAALPIFSKAWYATRPFDQTTLETPLGSGPYRLARFEQGRFVELERVPDYWAAKLPVRVGMFNFDRLRFEYFRDRTVGFEGFKGRAYLFREEFTSRTWATGYDFPAIRDGKVRRETLPDGTPSGAMGWFLNTRRPQFRDPRVREALSYAFDFEWTNANIMFGAYKRTVSFFENAPFKAEGPPSSAELALLEPWRGKTPDEVFSTPWTPAVSDGSGQDRGLIRRAQAMLTEAGCRREGTTLLLPDGKPFTIEFLDYEPSLQPHTEPFIKNLRLLGIEARTRTVDEAQFQKRRNAFDFDTVVQRYSLSLTPGETLLNSFGSRAAETPGSYNLSGIADPALDAMIAAAIAAPTRETLTVAMRALDRVLRAGRYWIPMWYKGSHTLAYWDVYGHPAQPPRYDRGALTTWWYDADKAKRIGL